MSGVLVVAISFVLAACSNSSTPSLPQPGANQIPQIYVLSDSANPLPAYWGFPGRDELISSLGARVEWTNVSDETQATETLKIWNARPVTLLILGPGVPVKVWKKLSLAKVPARKVLLVGESTQDHEAIAVSISRERIAAFLREYCALKLSLKGCRLIPQELAAGSGLASLTDVAGKRIVFIGSRRETLPDGSPLSLNLSIGWADFLNDVLSGKRGVGASGVERLDFFGGYLEARRGSALSLESDVKSFEGMKQRFVLEELSRRGAQ